MSGGDCGGGVVVIVVVAMTTMMTIAMMQLSLPEARGTGAPGLNPGASLWMPAPCTALHQRRGKWPLVFGC